MHGNHMEPGHSPNLHRRIPPTDNLAGRDAKKTSQSAKEVINNAADCTDTVTNSSASVSKSHWKLSSSKKNQLCPYIKFTSFNIIKRSLHIYPDKLFTQNLF